MFGRREPLDVRQATLYQEGAIAQQPAVEIPGRCEGSGHPGIAWRPRIEGSGKTVTPKEDGMVRDEAWDNRLGFSDDDEMDDLGYGSSFNDEDEDEEGWGVTKGSSGLWDEPEEASLEDEELEEELGEELEEELPLEEEVEEEHVFGTPPPVPKARPAKPVASPSVPPAPAAVEKAKPAGASKKAGRTKAKKAAKPAKAAAKASRAAKKATAKKKAAPKKKAKKVTPKKAAQKKKAAKKAAPRKQARVPKKAARARRKR